MQLANAHPCPPPCAKLARRRPRHLRIPAETMLTRAVLIGAARKLPTAELERVIEALITEADLLRAGDAEPDDDA